MSSCPIQVLNDTLAATGSTLTPVTNGEHRGLVDALRGVEDPRDPRGVRYPLAALLTVAVCAVAAGAVTFAALSYWLEDLDDDLLGDLGLSRRPVATTLWRVLVKVDPVGLGRALTRWLLARAQPQAPASQTPRGLRVVAIDGKTARGTCHGDGPATHIVSAYDTSTGITLARLRTGDKGGENALFKPLVDEVARVLGTGAGVLFAADALQARRLNLRDVGAVGAHLLVPVKGNQVNLFKRLRSLPWADVPVGHRTRARDHGRLETRTCKALTLEVPGGLAFGSSAQAVRITRTRTTGGRTSRETAYLVTTLTAEQAPAHVLNACARLEWHVENRLHWVKDVTLREDEQRARTGNGPAVFSVLREAVIAHHRTSGATNIARALARGAHRPDDLIKDMTSSGSTTQ